MVTTQREFTGHVIRDVEQLKPKLDKLQTAAERFENAESKAELLTSKKVLEPQLREMIRNLNGIREAISTVQADKSLENSWYRRAMNVLERYLDGHAQELSSKSQFLMGFDQLERIAKEDPLFDTMPELKRVRDKCSTELITSIVNLLDGINVAVLEARGVFGLGARIEFGHNPVDILKIKRIETENEAIV